MTNVKTNAVPNSVPSVSCRSLSRQDALLEMRWFFAAALRARPRPPEVDAMLSALSGCGHDRSGDAAAAHVDLSLAALEAGCDGFLAADD